MKDADWFFSRILTLPYVSDTRKKATPGGGGNTLRTWDCD